MPSNNLTNVAVALTATEDGDLTAKNTPPAAEKSKKLATTEWLYSGAMALIASAAGFEFSKATNGYIKFPSWLGGLIVNWGMQNAVVAGGGTWVTYAKPFPNAVLNTGATIQNTGGNSNAMAAGTGTGSLTSMPVYHNGQQPATAISWFAIGW